MGEAVVADRHLRDDGQIGDALRRAQRLVDLVHVGEGLQDEPVHPARHEPLHLPLEVRERLLPRQGAERLEPHPERPDGSHDTGAAGARFAGQLGRGPVDLFGVVGEPEGAELDRVGAERIGLEDLGAGADVGLVHFLDELGLFHAQLVVADVEKEALRIQHGAHRPVEDVDFAVIQEVAEGDGHPGVLANCLTWLQ